MRVEHLGFNENETFLVVTGTQASFNNFKNVLIMVIHLPSPRSTHSLTDRHICMHNDLGNLAKVEKKYSGQTLTGF